MNKKYIGEGSQPLICTPLVGKNLEAVLAELTTVLVKNPDVIEWRADFFEAIADTAAVIEVLERIGQAAPYVPIIFTIRSIREGGQPISLSDRAAMELNAAICKQTTVAYVDCELSNKPEDISYLLDIAHENNTKVIGSFHNFDYTPSREILAAKFAEAEGSGMDIAKVAVMPKSLEDVLTLLSVTLEAKRKLKIPLITMSMGGDGAITRLIGGIFGSSLSFAVGKSASAPGQIPIEELRTVLDIVQKSVEGR